MYRNLEKKVIYYATYNTTLAVFTPAIGYTQVSPPQTTEGITALIGQYETWILFGLILIALLVFLLIMIPKWQASKFTDQKERFNNENEARKTLAQIIGGAAILIGLFFSWQTLRVDKEEQITELFTRAIDQLGAKDRLGNKILEVRLGGIYALERIARDSERDHWQIMEVLTTYVRENAPSTPNKNKQVNKNKSKEDHLKHEEKPLKPDADIQAILTVIGRREAKYDKEGERLDLTEANLGGANLGGANLVGAKLGGAILLGAKLVGADLVEANLRGSHPCGSRP